MAGINELDLALLEQYFKLCRQYDAVHLKMGDYEFTLNPKQPDLTAFTAPPEDLGLPEDPGSAELTSPIPNVNVTRRKMRKTQYGPDGSPILDPNNPLSSANPIDFDKDMFLDDIPPVPGFGGLLKDD